MEGSPCEEISDCEDGLVCDGGFCARISPAPVASHGALVAIALLLAAFGMMTLVRRNAR
jgi:hypothetical protein